MAARLFNRRCGRGMSGVADEPGEIASLQAAQALYRTGDLAGAEARVAPLVERRPDWSVAVRILGLCRLKQGDVGAALALLQRAAALAPDDAWAQVHLAMALQTAARPAEAAPLLRAAAAGLPQDATPLVNLVGALLAMGDTAGAVAAGEEARRRAPGLAAAQYACGQALLAAGRWAQAETAFLAAVTEAPGFADAWVNLGLARYRSGRMGEAHAAMSRALEVAPRHRAALANLTAFERLRGQVDEPEALLRQALVDDPGSTGLRLNLAGLLLQDERAAEALDILDDAAPVGRHERQACALQRTLALLQLGRFDEARRTLEALGAVPPELEPLKAWREALLAGSRRDAAATRSKVLETEALAEAAGEALLPEHAITLRFDAARYWHAQGERDRAFAGWRAGHALLARYQPFSREQHRDFVDVSLEAFNAGRLRQGPVARNRDPAPVFIVGMPRSGTTLCEQILAAHSMIHGAGERIALGQALAELGAAPTPAQAARRIAGLDQDALDAAASAYLADLHRLSPDATHIVDKMPGNFQHLGLVARMLPGAKIIHCTRDPRDIGLSIFTFRFHGYHGYAHDLADLGWYIGEQDRQMTHWKSALPNPILTLRLTDWVDDFDATLQRLLDFIGVPFEAACARFYEAESRVRTVSRHQVRQPINARGLGRWRAYEAHLAPLIEELRRADML
jgi:tetratricopeptide (TPR) repeat protein